MTGGLCATTAEVTIMKLWIQRDFRKDSKAMKYYSEKNLDKL